MLISKIWALSLGLFVAGGEDPAPLGLEWLFRDPTWIGAAPENPRWSLDSTQVIFDSNPDGLEISPTFSLELDGTIRELPRDGIPVLPAGKSLDRPGRHAVFEDRGDLFVVDWNPPGGKLKLEQLTSTRAKEKRPVFSRDGTSVIFERDGNLYALQLEDSPGSPRGSIHQLTDFRGEDPALKKKPGTTGKTEGKEKPDFYRDQETELFEVIRERARRKKEREKEEKAERRRQNHPGPHWTGKGKTEEPTLSGDGRFVVFRQRQEASEAKTPRVATFITETGDTGEILAGTRAGAEIDHFRLGILDLEVPPGEEAVRWVDTSGIPGIDDHPLAGVLEENGIKSAREGPRKLVFHRARWSPNGGRALVQCYSLDRKDRWLLILDPESGALTSVDRHQDEAWIGGPGMGSTSGPGAAGWISPERIWYVSEAGTGRAHLWTLETGTGGKTALSSGSFEIFSPFLSRDRKQIYFHSSEGDPAERNFFRMAVEGGLRKRLTDLGGWNLVSLSPDEKQLAILHSRVNRPPEIYLKQATPGTLSRQMTHTASQEFLDETWLVPERVQVPAGDGAKIPGRIFSPVDDRGQPVRPGPAVIFVHGAGYLQEIRDAWPYYFHEYFFHNLLARRGYTVLEIDYRGSAGYGRDWRTAIYRHMGGRDMEDHLDAARWLVEERGVDPGAIGIYGGSYGGFIVFMALFQAPGVFACGAALRPVADWSHYHHGYVSRILHTPDVDPIAYRRSSPIHFAEGLTQPLLICHGMVDSNVRFQDTARLVQRLIELKKENWEVAIYPAEGHGFKSAASWLDEYRRILKLFETHLKPVGRRAAF